VKQSSVDSKLYLAMSCSIWWTVIVFLDLDMPSPMLFQLLPCLSPM